MPIRARGRCASTAFEVEIMTTNKNARKRTRLLNVTRLLVLAICFVAVFALALSAETFGWFGNTDISVNDNVPNIADASTAGSTNNAITASSLSSLVNFKDTNSSNYFPNSSSGLSKTWVYEHSLNSTAFGDSNVSVWSGVSNAGLSGGTGTFTIQSKGGSTGWNVTAVNFEINSTLLEQITNLKRIPNFGITVTFSTTNNITIDNWTSMRLYSSESKLSGSDLSSRGEDQFTNKSKSSSGDYSFSETIEVTESTRYLVLAFGYGQAWNNAIGKNAYVTPKNMSLKFELTLNTNDDESVRTYNDGSAPIVASSVLSDSNLANVHIPYRPTVSELSNENAWPVYNKDNAYINNMLTGVTDSVVNGNGKMISYQNAPEDNTYQIWGPGGNQFWKKRSVVNYIDTFDFTGSNGLTEELLKSWSNAEFYDKDNYKLMSVGGYQMTSYSGVYNRIDWSGGALNSAVTSGIKEVVVGDRRDDGAVFVTKDLGDGGAATKYLYVNGVWVGYARVTRDSRSKISVAVYVWANASVTTQVSDFGNNKISTTIEYSGIDTTAPETMALNSSQTNTNKEENIDWTYTSNVTLSADDKTRANTGAPYIWFYSAAYEPSKAKGFSQLTSYFSQYGLSYSTYKEFISAYGSLGRTDTPQPFAVGTMPNFVYDFTTGQATGQGTVQGRIDNIGGKNYTGCGYYMFTFYGFDLAGNAAAQVNYYVKADYLIPEYYVTYQYMGSDGNFHPVLPKSEYDAIAGNPDFDPLTKYNTQWLTGEVRLELDLSHSMNNVHIGDNISGTTIAFADSNNRTHILVIDDGKLLLYAVGSGERIKPSEINNSSYKTDNSNWDEPTQTLTLDVQTEHDAAILTIQLTQTEHDGHMHSNVVFTCANRTLADGKTYKNLKWALNFNAYAGQDTVDKNTAWHTSRWGSGGINVNVDRNNPITPVLKENNDTGRNVYLENLGNGLTLNEITIKDINSRKWFTTLTGGRLTLPSSVEFSDALTGSYGENIIVSVGFRTFASLDDFKNSDLTTFIADFYTSTIDQRRSYFTQDKKGAFTSSGSNWNGYDSNMPWSLSLNLMKDFDAGIRVIFAWAIDQAGNLSGLNAYYVLADPNTYSISADTIQNKFIGENKARVSAANPADNDQNRNYRRGQTVKFTFGFDDTYVPYTFGRNMGDTVTNLLYNNTQNVVWQINKEFNGVGTLGTGSPLTFEYVLDEADDISKLAADLALKFELTYRRVVDINLTNSMVQYTSLPTVAPMTYSVPTAADHVKLVYYYGNINEKAVLTEYDNGRTDLSEADRNKPIIPNKTGEWYYLKIWIPQDDPDFVQSNYAEDSDGNQIFYIEDVSVDGNGNVIPNDHTHIRKYTIINGTAEIKATATQSTYNDPITVTYTINGYTPEEAYRIYTGHNLKGRVSLNGIAMREGMYGTSYLDANNKIGVGNYMIVASEAFSLDYYDVTFSSDFHEVIARTIYVDVEGDEKIYGEADPLIKFNVDSNQFADRQNVVDEVFTKELFGNPLAQTPDGIYTFNSGSRISRAVGENVGEYRYTANSAAFDVSSNYVISVRTNAQFYIRQREIKLDVSGQSTVRPISDNFDPNKAEMWNSIRPVYTFVNADDVRFADMITGSPMLESYIGAKSEDGYTAVYEFRIGKGTIEDTLNIRFTIVSEQDKDTIYTIYIAGAGTVIIRAKEDAAFKYVFGTVWNSKTTLRFDADMFDIEKSDELVIDKIEWEANFPDIVDGGYMPIGIARVSIVNAKIYRLVEGSTDQYEEIVDFTVFVEAVNVTVDQAEITVRPTATSTEKTYGEADVTYGFGFEIEAINGTPISEIGNSFANILVDDIKKAISGSFARGVYSADGNFKTSGTRYDGASDKKGTVLGAIDANGTQAECTDFYGYSVGVAFSSSDTSFKVATNLHKEEHLVINPYVLVVNDSMFIGKSKVKDNTTTVTYGNDELALDLSRLLVNGSDDVKVSFKAEYGSANIGKTFITFTKLGLVGEKGASYVLALDNASHIVTDADSVKIFYINNAKDSHGNIIDSSEANEIWIKAGEIAVLKSDVTISKQYDNTTVLNIGNVAVRNRTDAKDRGTSQLSTAMSNGKATLLGGKYTASDVSNNYMTTVVIFFEIDMTGITIYRSENYANPDVAPRRVDNEDILGDGVLRTGVELTIRNAQASIVKRVLNENSFINVAAQDRAYNATCEVEVTFAYKDGALAHGETAESVGVRLFADTANREKDTGDYQVVFSDSRIQKSDSYEVDIASLNKYFSGARQLNVHISRAMLYPNVEFKDKEYNGSDTVELKVKEGTAAQTDLTTQEYATELRKELECFSYNKDDVVFVYSANGRSNANVTVDGEGNTLMHNVMIKNLVITENGGNGYLKNYAILGSRYAGSSYSAVGSVTNAEKNDNSYTISDYEMLEAAKLTKRPVVISDNDINLSDKVFDGTTDAPVTVSMPDQIVESDREHFKLTASAKFSRMHVGNNSIDVSDITIAPNAGFEYLMNNYAIQVRHGTLAKNIFAKPIAVSVDLGSQVYDGTPNVKSRNITYGMEGFIGSDASKYNIDATAAYFIDKNVAVDNKGNVIRKDGTVYNLLLSNPTQNFMNYVLADKVVIDRNNTAQPSDPDASVAADDQTPAQPQVKEGYFAYELEDGTIVYGTPEKFDGVVAVYYELGVATKYIPADDATAIAAAKQQNALIGYFRTPDGKNCYLVTDDYSGTVQTLVTPVTYSKNASGIIEKRAVSISSVSIKNGNTVIEKEFDGTNKYFGVKGEDYEFDGIYNKVGNDKVEVNEVSAKFSSANTDARYVLFTASSITGDDAQNYTFDASRQVSVPGRITQRTITAQLHDGSVPYGTLASEVGGKVTYTISRVIRTVTPNEVEGEDDIVTEKPVTYDLIQDGNAFYLEFNKFLVIVGFIDDINGSVKQEDVAYVDELRKESYNKLADGSFQLATDGNGQYRRLSGTFSALPKPVANFGTESRPSAGTVITDYTLTEGKAGNYKFQPKYSDADKDSNGTTSKLTITKRNLYVTTSVKYYGRLYGEVNPDIRVIYTDDDRNTLNAIVSGESPNTIFGSTDRFPKAAFGIYNAKTGAITPVASNALATADLEEGLFYVAYITLEGFNAEASNYNVIVATLGYSEEDGVYYSFDGGNLENEVATTLEITLPELSGITAVANAQVTYNGNDQTSAIVNGIAAGDRVQFIDANNGRVSAVDADTYTGQVVVSRDLAPVAVNGKTYSIEWRSSQDVTLVIGKASPRLSADNKSTSFNGKVQSYDKNNVRLGVDGLDFSNDDISLTVMKRVGNDYVKSELRDAGNYRVTVKFTSRNRNYNDESVDISYVISKAVIRIDITSQLEQIFDENNDYSVDYTVGANSFDITKADTVVKFYKNDRETEIERAGRYQYRVTLVGEWADDIDNFTLMGGMGNLDLTVNSISDVDSNVVKATVAIKDEGTILADRLSTRVVYEYNTSSRDDLYYQSISGYMPYISNSVGTDAKISAIIRMELSYGSTNTNLDGKSATVTVALPDNVKNTLDETAIYIVNKNGGLTKLTDYEIKNGNITYSADHLGSLVFVKLGTEGQLWILYTVLGVVGGLLLIAAIIVTVTVIRKKQLEKLV